MPQPHADHQDPSCVVLQPGICQFLQLRTWVLNGTARSNLLTSKGYSVLDLSRFSGLCPVLVASVLVASTVLLTNLARPRGQSSESGSPGQGSTSRLNPSWFPAFSILFRDPLLCFGVICNLKTLCIPGNFLPWETNAEGSKEDGLG